MIKNKKTNQHMVVIKEKVLTAKQIICVLKENCVCNLTNSSSLVLQATAALLASTSMKN